MAVISAAAPPRHRQPSGVTADAGRRSVVVVPFQPRVLPEERFCNAATGLRHSTASCRFGARRVRSQPAASIAPGRRRAGSVHYTRASPPCSSTRSISRVATGPGRFASRATSTISTRRCSGDGLREVVTAAMNVVLLLDAQEHSGEAQMVPVGDVFRGTARHREVVPEFDRAACRTISASAPLQSARFARSRRRVNKIFRVAKHGFITRVKEYFLIHPARSVWLCD